MPPAPGRLRPRNAALAALWLVGFLAGCGHRRAAIPVGPAGGLDARLDALMRQQASEFSVPGLQLGVIKGGRVVFAGACGVGNLQTGRAITRRSLFHMASVSKPFVSTAILQLAEQGKLGLDDRVTEHLPYFRLEDERYRLITIRQLLLHTSGMPDVHD
jgi:CubicO group peptidase (beta-lactamase class C family)